VAKGGPGDRIYRSLAWAGLSGAAAVLIPADLPGPPAGVPWVPVPPIVPPAFFASAKIPDIDAPESLPEAFVLAAGEGATTLPLILAAWTWVESSMGDSFTLLLAAEDEASRASAESAVERLGLSGTVRCVRLADEVWPAAFRRAALVLHGGESRNTAALRWALAGEVPLVAAATSVSEAIAGPAGYLVEPEARALGAACLSLLVDEGFAESLRRKGGERARGYASKEAAALAAALRRVARAPAPRSRSVQPG